MNVLLLFAGWLTLGGVAAAQGVRTVVPHPVLDRFADAVTFYQNFEYGGLAVMSVGAGRPFGQTFNQAGQGTTNDPIVVESGIRGRSLKAGAWKYQAAGNLDMVRPGTLCFWIEAREWVRSKNEPTFCPLMIMCQQGYLLLGRQGLIVEEGVLKQGETFFLQARGGKNKLTGNLVNYHGSKSWKNERHLFAVQWRPGRIAWSLDGGAFHSCTLSESLGQAQWFQFGVDGFLPPGQEVLLDELMILNRELTDDEVRWLFAQP